MADVARERGALYRAMGRNPETLRALNEAHRLFEQLRARRELLDVDRRLGELEEEFLEIVREWGASMERKDTYTQGHCDRVADYACRLAAVAGMDDWDLKWFRMGALLHDVGKVSVPLEILNKPGPLTDEEMAVMATHPAEGGALLEGVEFPGTCAP
jgi:HD-GYP domain-containing protein (c-di-GMP phosphodiesterase class II)